MCIYIYVCIYKCGPLTNNMKSRERGSHALSEPCLRSALCERRLVAFRIWKDHQCILQRPIAYVYIYTYIYTVYLYVNIYVSMYVCMMYIHNIIYIYLYQCLYTCMYTFMCVYIYIYMHIHMHVCNICICWAPGGRSMCRSMCVCICDS